MAHKFRAKKFYQLLNKVKENEVTFYFDLMQNQELSRSPIKEAFTSTLALFLRCCNTQRKKF